MDVFLKQRGSLPEMAGLAKLVYGDVKQPSRKGETITLPSEGWAIYQLNNDFSQFIAMKVEAEKHDFRDTPPRKTWFGGTDERPFLVEMGLTSKSGDWVEVWRKDSFYETIKPEIIQKFEKYYGREKLLRQGDMFCYPMPIQEWGKLLCVLETVRTLHFMRYGSGNPPEKSDPYPTTIHDPESLYGTRHEFCGELATWGDFLIGKGTLKAPDHKDLVLKDICVIAQTANLANAKKAD